MREDEISLRKGSGGTAGGDSKKERGWAIALPVVSAPDLDGGGLGPRCGGGPMCGYKMFR